MVRDDVPHHTIEGDTVRLAGSHVWGVIICAGDLAGDFSFDVPDRTAGPNDHAVVEIGTDERTIGTGRTNHQFGTMILRSDSHMLRQHGDIVERRRRFREFVGITVEMIGLVGIEPELAPAGDFPAAVGTDVRLRDVRHCDMQAPVLVLGSNGSAVEGKGGVRSSQMRRRPVFVFTASEERLDAGMKWLGCRAWPRPDIFAVLVVEFDREGLCDISDMRGVIDAVRDHPRQIAERLVEIVAGLFHRLAPRRLRCALAVFDTAAREAPVPGIVAALPLQEQQPTVRGARRDACGRDNLVGHRARFL